MPIRSARFLPDQQVSAGERREHDGSPTLARLEISERKWHDNQVVAYKFRLASSSSGVSQSAAEADSASNSDKDRLTKGSRARDTSPGTSRSSAR